MKKLLVILVLGLLWFGNVNASTIADELTKLNTLYKEGAITKEEFSKAKQILFKSETIEEKTETKKSETKKQEKKKVIITNKTEDEKKIVKARTFDEDLSKTFMTLKEVDELGTYKKIEKIPDGMFKVKMSSKGRAQEAMMKMYDVFVIKKNLMEKYPEDLMRAMGYFEFFYMQQLDDEKKTIKKFKEKYPDIRKGLKKKMQGLYSLNQARKSMRESMALTLDDDPESTYVSRHSKTPTGFRN